MHQIFVLLIIITQMCFASPFDLADEDDEEIRQKKEDMEISSVTNTIQPIIAEDIQQPEINKIQPFVETNKAKFIAIDIRNGRKQEFILTTGDSIKIDNSNFKLRNCYIEKDYFHHKISIAPVFIDGKNFTLSNETNIGNSSINNMLLIVDCISR
jgi:hypothetical protein